MKYIQTAFLVFFLGLIIISCKTGDNIENSITGKWTIENIDSQDSTSDFGVQLLLVVAAMDGFDHLEFTTDGMYRVLSENDSVLTSSEYKISQTGDMLSVVENGEEKSMNIVSQTENELVLESTEGVTMTLNRKE